MLMSVTNYRMDENALYTLVQSSKNCEWDIPNWRPKGNWRLTEDETKIVPPTQLRKYTLENLFLIFIKLFCLY